MTHEVTPNSVEGIVVYVTDAFSAALSGKTDLYVRIRRGSDGFFLDWSDSTFKNSGWTTLDQLLTEQDAVLSQGTYEAILDLSVITNLDDPEDLIVIPSQTPGTDAVLPGPAELLVRGSEGANQIANAPTPWPPAPNSLLDRLANKDAGQGYNQSSDSLEAIRDRIG